MTSNLPVDVSSFNEAVHFLFVPRLCLQLHTFIVPLAMVRLQLKTQPLRILCLLHAWHLSPFITKLSTFARIIVDNDEDCAGDLMAYDAGLVFSLSSMLALRFFCGGGDE